MATSKPVRREACKLFNSRTLGVTSLVLLLGSGPSWAGTASDGK
jgi:hypothetical protein